MTSVWLNFRNLLWLEAEVRGQLDSRIDPELRFAVHAEHERAPAVPRTPDWLKGDRERRAVPQMRWRS